MLRSFVSIEQFFVLTVPTDRQNGTTDFELELKITDMNWLYYFHAKTVKYFQFQAVIPFGDTVLLMLVWKSEVADKNRCIPFKYKTVGTDRLYR